MIIQKPKLSFWKIVSMNVGFFGIQYSFGLQQSNMSPIYKYLGANEAELLYLWLTGPLTGLIIQPIIGAMSDKTLSKMGRRTPYFLIGAIFASIGLFFMPFSRTLWMAAGLLWILDAENVIRLAGVLLICGAASVLLVKVNWRKDTDLVTAMAAGGH